MSEQVQPSTLAVEILAADLDEVESRTEPSGASVKVTATGPDAAQKAAEAFIVTMDRLDSWMGPEKANGA